MTRRHLRGILPALTLLMIAGPVGCGSSTLKPGLTSPHGGVLVELPEGKGIAEVLRQVAPGKAGRSVIVVYFLDKDRNPMTSPPTVATLKGRTTGDKPIAFKPVDGALTSEPIADRGEIEGELTVTVDGGPATIPILIR